MAQADQTVQNATFPTVRADINNNLAALFSNNSGNTAPTVTVAFQDWIDTSGTDPVWKKRNAANNAWITIGTLTGSTVAFEGTLPSQTGNAGEYLTTNGTVASWAAVPPGSSAEVFTSSGTWTKPSSGTRVRIELWGGGGSGGSRASSGNNIGGGGGGACTIREFPLSLFAATCVVTIGNGATAPAPNASGATGGTSSFVVNANYTVFAYGGAGGDANGNGTTTYGGGGGGSSSAGVTTDGGSSEFISNALEQGGDTGVVGDVDAYYGGAGAGGVTSGNSIISAGAAYYGGGGGGGSRINGVFGAGGKSAAGGSGGSGASSNGPGSAGVAPGGGGGGGNPGGNGARGECRVYVW